MSLPDEFEKLNALHDRGALTDEEFALAKLIYEDFCVANCHANACR